VAAGGGAKDLRSDVPRPGEILRLRRSRLDAGPGSAQDDNASNVNLKMDAYCIFRLACWRHGRE